MQEPNTHVYLAGLARSRETFDEVMEQAAMSSRAWRETRGLDGSRGAGRADLQLSDTPLSSRPDASTSTLGQSGSASIRMARTGTFRRRTGHSLCVVVVEFSVCRGQA